jgi:hypothetical protein
MDQHYLDPNGLATQRGNYTENLYERKLVRRKLEYRPANRFEQKMHWDYLVGTAKIETKAGKRINRYDAKPAWDLVVLELHGYQHYNTGWLKGQADFIAFEQEDGSFFHFKREELLKYIEKKLEELKIEKKEYDHNPIPYQTYHRWNNKLESFCYVPLEDLLLHLRVVKLK